jgi:hypothetical protein
MVQSLNTKVDLTIDATSFLGINEYGKIMIGDNAFEFYNDRDKRKFIQIPWEDVDYVIASVLFKGRWIPRYAIRTKKNDTTATKMTAPMIAGTIAIPATCGPQVPNKPCPIDAPTSPATISKMQPRFSPAMAPPIEPMTAPTINVHKKCIITPPKLSYKKGNILRINWKNICSLVIFYG